LKLTIKRFGLILALLNLTACKSTSETTTIQFTQAPEWTWVFAETQTNTKAENLRLKARKAYLYEWDKENNKHFDKTLSTSALYQQDGSIQSISEFTCEQKLSIAKKETVKKLYNIRFFDYQLIDNTATGTRMHPQRNIMLKEASTANTYHYTDTMLWDYGSAETGIKGVGMGSAMVNIIFSCNQDNNAQSIIQVTNMSTSNPIVDLGFTQDIANLFVNKKIQYNAKQFFSNTFYIGDHKHQLDRLLKDIMKIQNSRFSVSDKKTIEYPSWNHKVNFELAISRVQRKLTKLKYNNDTNSFWYEEKLNIKGAEIIMTSTYSLFPEANDSIQIVANATYKTLFDNMQDKILFSDDDAELLINNTHKRISIALDSM
jgi:hypothetical protein